RNARDGIRAAGGPPHDFRGRRSGGGRGPARAVLRRRKVGACPGVLVEDPQSLTETTHETTAGSPLRPWIRRRGRAGAGRDDAGEALRDWRADGRDAAWLAALRLRPQDQRA